MEDPETQSLEEDPELSSVIVSVSRQTQSLEEDPEFEMELALRSFMEDQRSRKFRFWKFGSPEYKLSSQLRGHKGHVRRICVCGDTCIATLSMDETIRFWTLNPLNYKSSKILPVHTSFVGALAFSANEEFPQGRIIYGEGKRVIVWNSVNAEKCTLEGHKGLVTGIAVEGSDIISSSTDCTLRRWRGGQQVEVWEAHKEEIQALKKLPSGELITGSTDRTVKLWNGKTWLRTFFGHSGTVTSLAVMPGLGFLSASNDGSIRLWALSGEVLLEMVGHTSVVKCVDAIVDGHIVSGSVDCSAKIWKDGYCLQSIEHPGRVWDAKFLPNGDIVTACSDGVVRVWTTNPERYADPQEAELYASLVSRYSCSIPRKKVGGLKPTELPHLEALQIPGTSDWQTKVVREGDSCVADALNMIENKGHKIGEVDRPDWKRWMDSELGAMEDELMDIWSAEDYVPNGCEDYVPNHSEDYVLNDSEDYILNDSKDYVLIDSDERKWLMEKFMLLGVKFFRLLYRLWPLEKSLAVRNCLCALISAAEGETGQPFDFVATKVVALLLEENGKEDINFSLNILVLGKSGVGKSSTINSIFGEEKAEVNAFDHATTSVQEIIGVVDGVKIRVFDTPGLKCSVLEQSFNKRMLNNVKEHMKKHRIDVVFYVDRMDALSRTFDDLHILQMITITLGSSLWRRAILVLTNAASDVPQINSYFNFDVFVDQQSLKLKEGIRKVARYEVDSVLDLPHCLVENHVCPKNNQGQKILPNGNSWRSELMIRCYSMKIISEAFSLSKPPEPSGIRKLFGFLTRLPSLVHLKFSTGQNDNEERRFNTTLAQLSIGRCSKVDLRAGINNKLIGQISLVTSSCEQLAPASILRAAISICKKLNPGVGKKNSRYVYGFWVDEATPFVLRRIQEGIQDGIIEESESVGKVRAGNLRAWDMHDQE